MKRLGLTLTLALALGGCSMAPVYHRPAPPIPPALPQGTGYPALNSGDGAVDTIGWHAFFTDPRLQRVIARALNENRDLRATVANVAAARAQYRITHAATLPTITATPAISRYHGAVSASGYTNGRADAGAGQTTDAFGISAGSAAFELDLWGRVRSLSRAALETWLASDEGRKSAQIALIAEVADAWLTVGADADALAIARDTVASRDQSLAQARSRAANGIGTAFEVAQAQAFSASARADLASYTTALASADNALQLLAGATIAPADLPATLGTDDAVLHALPVGLSSAVLLRRPDVRAAEHTLIAANANIGAARAAMFPTISLTGLIGLASGSLGGLFDGGGTFSAGVAGAAAQTLFDNGAKGGALDAANARRDAAVAQYERAVQSAFSDVANALARRGTIDDQLAAATAYVAASSQAATISEARYRGGVDSSLAALDAARTAYAARQALVNVRRDRATNMVALYQVLGGGLQP